MLVLSRHEGEKLIITTPQGDRAEVCVVSINGDKVRLGVEAPKEITVHRKEVQDQIDEEGVGLNG